MSESENAFDSERGRGILTKMDREYLLGEKESQNETRIRNRIRNALYDFGFLAAGRGQELLADVLRDVKSPSQSKPLTTLDLEDSNLIGDSDLIGSLKLLQYSLYQALALDNPDSPAEPTPFDPKDDAYRMAVEAGIREAMEVYFDERGYHSNIGVQLAITVTDSHTPQDLVEYFEDDKFLTLSEIQFLLEEGAIVENEAIEYTDRRTDEEIIQMYAVSNDPALLSQLDNSREWEYLYWSERMDFLLAKDGFVEQLRDRWTGRENIDGSL